MANTSSVPQASACGRHCWRTSAVVWQLNGPALARRRHSVGEPAAQPCEATGAEAALGEVVDAVRALGLFSDHHSVARRVAAGGTIVPLGGATAGHRLSGVVPGWVGSLSLAVEPGCLLAAGHRIVPRGWHHPLLLAGRVVRRSLLHVTLCGRVEHCCPLVLLWHRRCPTPGLLKSFPCNARVVGRRGLVSSLRIRCWRLWVRWRLWV